MIKLLKKIFSKKVIDNYMLINEDSLSVYKNNNLVFHLNGNTGEIILK